jgi:ABC-type metal ion transport system substrate-binding protein
MKNEDLNFYQPYHYLLSKQKQRSMKKLVREKLDIEDNAFYALLRKSRDNPRNLQIIQFEALQEALKTVKDETN